MAAAPAPNAGEARSGRRHISPSPCAPPATEDDAFSAAMKTFMFQGIQLQQQALTKNQRSSPPGPSTASTADAAPLTCFAALRENINDDARDFLSDIIVQRVKAKCVQTPNH